MVNKKNNTFLSLAIIIAAVLVSGALVYLGTTMKNGVSKDQIKTAVIDGLNEFVQKGPQAAANPSDNGGGAVAQNVNASDFVDDDAVMGEDDAPVTIVEFSDFQCPYCRSFFKETMAQIEENYVKTGKVKFVFRDFPLSFHELAMPAAMAAECARDQGDDSTYFAMHNKLFGDDAAFKLSVEEFTAKLVTFASDLGLDGDEFQQCLKEERFKDEINKDIEDGKKAGISGTPAFLINGEKLVGAQPYTQFQQIIDKALEANQ